MSPFECWTISVWSDGEDGFCHVEGPDTGGDAIKVVRAETYQWSVEALRRAVVALGRVQDGDLHPGRNLAREYVAAKNAIDAARTES
jgi:hypothetical protein